MSGDVSILKGLDSIINPDNIRPGANLKLLEDQMISGGIIDTKSVDIQDTFTQEMQNTAKLFGIDFGSSENESQQTSQQKYGQHSNYQNTNYQNTNQHDEESESEDNTNYANNTNNTNYTNYTKDPDPTPSQESNDNPFKRSPTELEYRTQEHERRQHISSIIGNSHENYSFEQEKREDKKSEMLAEIDSLMEMLKTEDVDLSRIPDVDIHSSYEEVESVLRKLRYKSDHIRYSTFFEELVIFGAYGLEEIFDGKKTYFGRKPNLVGWHNNVNVKLRRMRHDTGQLMSNFMQEYNMGPAARLILELLPNAFLFSKMKSEQQNQPDMFSDDEMADANINLSTITN